MTGTDTVPCEYCGSEYTGVGGLRRHQLAVHADLVTVSVRCAWCGETLERAEWNADGRTYCDTACSTAFTTFLNQGQRHPDYIDGSTRSADFRYLAMAVRARDGGCRLCGREQCVGDDRALPVHHITPEREADNPHRPQNLIAVCDECHQHLESLPEEDQLAECGIESRDELSFDDEHTEWIDSVTGLSGLDRDDIPNPWPGMFSHAQDVLAEREAAD